MKSRRIKKRHIVLITLVVLIAGGYFYFTRDTRDIKVLIFSKTMSYRHESIAAGIEAIRELGQQHGFSVDTTENSESFNEKTLRNYNVIIFLSTTGNVLNDAQQLEMNRWVQVASLVFMLQQILNMNGNGMEILSEHIFKVIQTIPMSAMLL